MFRFTIRDVLWLMVVAAFATLWFLERDGRIEETERIRNAFRENVTLKEELRATQLELRLEKMPHFHPPMVK